MKYKKYRCSARSKKLRTSARSGSKSGSVNLNPPLAAPLRPTDPPCRVKMHSTRSSLSMARRRRRRIARTILANSGNSALFESLHGANRESAPRRSGEPLSSICTRSTLRACSRRRCLEKSFSALKGLPTKFTHKNETFATDPQKRVRAAQAPASSWGERARERRRIRWQGVARHLFAASGQYRKRVGARFRLYRSRILQVNTK